MKNSICKYLVCIAFFVSACFTASAQNRSVARQDENDDDQIVEMLDSLVNIKYISRISLKKAPAVRSTFQPNDIPTYPDEVIRQRLGKLQSPIQLTYNDQVKKYIDLYVNKRRELASITLGLARLYFPLFEQVLDQYGLPLELKYLAVVESALNPIAVSRVGATGLWQFMYNTGKVYNLEINSYIDERRDAYKSTVAACQYLKEMYAIYHDWLLVIASYNCGPGNVNKAIIRSGGKTNFWEIAKYLPKETRGYVPAFIAVNYMMNYAPEHNISPIPCVISYLELDTLNVTKRYSLNEVATTLGVSTDLVRFLNPIYKKNLIPLTYDKPAKLILPANKVAAFLVNSENLSKSQMQDTYQPPVFTQVNKPAVSQPPVTTQPRPVQITQVVETKAPAVKNIRKIHIVRKGENIDNISDKYECSVAEIREWNHIKNTHLRNGQRLIIYLSNDTQNHLMAYNEGGEKPEIVKPAQKVKYIYHVVQKGDTLYSIAQKYEGVSLDQLRKMNRISSISKKLKPGTRIKVALNV